MSGNIKDSKILILYDEIYQHLKDLFNSENGYFPNDQLIFTNWYFPVHTTTKLLMSEDPLIVQDWPVDFNGT